MKQGTNKLVRESVKGYREHVYKLRYCPNLTLVGASFISTHNLTSQQTLIPSWQIPHISVSLSRQAYSFHLAPSIRRAAFVTSSLNFPFKSFPATTITSILYFCYFYHTTISSLFPKQDLSSVLHPVNPCLVPLAFPHMLSSFMQAIHLHSLCPAIRLPVLHHSKSQKWSWDLKPGPVRIGIAVLFKEQKTPVSLLLHNPM